MILAIGGGQMTGEEVLEFEDTARGMHILICGDARDRGLVHADFLGDVSQYHWFHRLVTLIEMVGSGLGVTLLPTLAADAVARTGAEVALVPFTHPRPART